MPITFTLKNNVRPISELSDLYQVKQEFLGLVINDDEAMSAINEIVNIDVINLLLSELRVSWGSLDELNTLLKIVNNEVIFSQDDATYDYVVILKENGDLSKSDYSPSSFASALSNLFIKTALLEKKYVLEEDCDQYLLMKQLKTLSGYVQNGTDSSLRLKYEDGFYKIQNVLPFGNKLIWEYRDVSLVKLIKKVYSMHKDDND